MKPLLVVEWNGTFGQYLRLPSVVIESDGLIRRGFSEILVENEAWLLSEIGDHVEIIYYYM